MYVWTGKDLQLRSHCRTDQNGVADVNCHSFAASHSSELLMSHFCIQYQPVKEPLDDLINS